MNNKDISHIDYDIFYHSSDCSLTYDDYKCSKWTKLQNMIRISEKSTHIAHFIVNIMTNIKIN